MYWAQSRAITEQIVPQKSNNISSMPSSSELDNISMLSEVIKLCFNMQQNEN
jgi:hypothetical protein